MTLDQPRGVVSVAERKQRLAVEAPGPRPSTVSKCRTQSRFSLSVRMKRAAQQLPSGVRTKAGLQLRLTAITCNLQRSWRLLVPASA